VDFTGTLMPMKNISTQQVTVQPPLHTSDAAQTTQFEKKSVMVKSDPNKGKGSERLPQQEYKDEAFVTSLANYTMSIAIIGGGISIGSAIFGFGLFTLDQWLNFLQGIPLIFATLASGAAVASSFFYTQLQYVFAQRQYVLAQGIADAQTKELMRQRYERTVDSAAEMRNLLLLKMDVPSDIMVRAKESREAVEQIFKSLTPYLANINDLDELRIESKKIIDDHSAIKESQYIQQLLRLSSIANKAEEELNDKSIADYIWVLLYPEEYLMCTILIAAGKNIVIPSEDQFDNLQSALKEMVPWNRNIDLKPLFTKT
jgi:hypothetical protein